MYRDILLLEKEANSLKSLKMQGMRQLLASISKDTKLAFSQRRYYKSEHVKHLA